MWNAMSKRESMNMRRHRFRRNAKWAATISCSSLLIISVLNLGWIMVWTYPRWSVSVRDEAVHVVWISDNSSKVTLESNCCMKRDYSPGELQWWPKGYVGPVMYTLDVPLWMLLVVGIVPTAVLWRRDSRGSLRDICVKCRSNLAGNASRICPECGTERTPIVSMSETARRRSRTRRKLKRTSLAFSLLVLAAWITSMFVWVNWVDDPNTPKWALSVAESRIRWEPVIFYEILRIPGQELSSWRVQTLRNPFLIPCDIFQKGDFNLLIRTFGLQLPRFDLNWNVFMDIPFWAIFATGALITIALFRLDRPPKPGHCPSCNYNLTGNTSGICPECGTPCQTANT